MGSKTLTLSNLAIAQRDKGAKARARKVKKRIEKSPAKWLGKEWSVMVARRFPGVTVEWGGAEFALAKKLIDEQGFDKAVEIIDHFLGTWDRRKMSRKGMPGFKLLWVMRDTLIAEIKGLAKVPELRETRIASGEYSEEGADASPSQGWGDIKEDLTPYEDKGSGW